MRRRYTYGNREQILTADPYLYDGEDSTGENEYVFDAKGNMRYRYWQGGDVATEYEWNEDNRLIAATEWFDPIGEHEYENGNVTEFRYDHEGRRIIKEAQHGILHVGETERTRYFFHGLTEDIKKVSVPGAHGDGAFEFLAKEDGASASEWYAVGSTAVVSAGADADRRSSVIELTLDPGNNCTFFVGDSGSNSNPNDAPWNSTKRTLSFWYRGEFAQCKVLLTSAAGERWIDYRFTTGTSSASGANVTFYLGTMPTTTWTRFERNVEADYESLSGSAWTNTDGLQIKLVASYSDPDMTLDDIRLSDSLTVEHNTLGPGMIGHILRHTTWDATTLAKTDRWFHYDQVGSVMNETNAAGTLQNTHHMDAFGNAQVSWDGGLWDAGAEGWGFQTKESGILFTKYFYARHLFHEVGLFLSQAPFPPTFEARYSFGLQRPSDQIDPRGHCSNSYRIAQVLLCFTPAGGGDKFMHCALSCELTRCSGPAAAMWIGVVKEFFDSMGFGTPSADDLLADAAGVAAGLLPCVGCRDACSTAYSPVPAPGAPTLPCSLP